MDSPNQHKTKNFSSIASRKHKHHRETSLESNMPCVSAYSKTTQHSESHSHDDYRSHNVHASMKRKRVAQVHQLSHKRGRDKFNKRLRDLCSLIPNCTKIDEASVLDEAIEYLKLLQLQLQIMPFFAGLCVPPTQMILPTQYPIIGCSAIDLRFGLPFAGYGTQFQMPLPMNALLPVASASLRRSAQSLCFRLLTRDATLVKLLGSLY